MGHGVLFGTVADLVITGQDSSMPDRPRTSDRVLQSPCEWCGAAISHPVRGGRRRSYCNQTCRQRAYEARTAARRLDRDLEIERHRPAPAERIVERVMEPGVPQRIGAWVETLEHLVGALESGAIAWHQQARVAELLVAADTAVRQNARRFPAYFRGTRFIPTPRPDRPQGSPPNLSPPAKPRPQPISGFTTTPVMGNPTENGLNRAQRRALAKARKKSD